MPKPANESTQTASDTDPQETREWLDALDALVTAEGPQRAAFLLDQLVASARAAGVGWQPELCTPYQNTIAVNDQPAFPGDLAMEERLGSLMRWNALAMWRERTRRTASWADTSPVTPALPICLRLGSIISFMRGTMRIAVTWFSFSRTVRRAFMPAPILRGD